MRPLRATVLLCLALGGCAAVRQPQTGAPVPRPADGARSETRPQPPPADDAAAPVSRVLLERSRTERAAGNTAAAASSIERALRIDPNNAALWLELGEIKLAAGDAQQAQMMARKALTLTGGQPALAERAQRLIERACVDGGC